jgi:hypothetical protein
MLIRFALVLCVLLVPSLLFAQTPLPQTGWMLVSVHSQAPSYPAVAAFDGDPETFWHTAYAPSEGGHPHSLTLDLGAVQLVNGFRYLPRQDDNENGRIADYTFATSLDARNWSSGIKGTLANVGHAQTVSISARPARYVRLTVRSDVAGQDFTSIAELAIVRPDPAVVVTPASRLAWEHDNVDGLVGFRLWVDGRLTAIPDLQQSRTGYTSGLPAMAPGEHVLKLAAYTAAEESAKVTLYVTVDAAADNQ